MHDASRPEWWHRAAELEQRGALEAAEQVITTAVSHIGAAACVAELYATRMRRLVASGDATGAAVARAKAVEWIHWYASQATSGGEGAALSLERDAFLTELGP